MKSIGFFEYGAPAVLQVIDRPVPQPAKGEVVVRIAASTVNPSDLMMRRGEQAALMQRLSPPFFAGMEFSGHIHSVGEGVSLTDGQPVIGVINPRRPEGGAHTQYLCLPASQVAVVPITTDLVSAATVPMNALTALRALEMANLQPGQLLLVTGGAGILGGSVLQLARQAGLVVVANAAPDDEELLRSLGAKFVIPRDEGMAEAFKAQFPNGVDALIDGALIGAKVSGLVRDGGIAISLRKSHPIPDPRLRCKYVSVVDAMTRADFWHTTVTHLASGALKARVAEGGVFPMAQAALANEMAETWRGRGRIVLTFA